jgi:hypothetical protein
MCAPDVVCGDPDCSIGLEYWYTCDGCGFDYAVVAANKVLWEATEFLLCDDCLLDYKRDRIVLYA